MSYIIIMVCIHQNCFFKKKKNFAFITTRLLCESRTPEKVVKVIFCLLISWQLFPVTDGGFPFKVF